MSEKKYKVMPLKEILKYEDEMKAEKVSEVARSQSGFLGQYKKHKTYNNFKNNKVPNGLIDWNEKRDAFIDRHLAQYEKNPTRRRRLALIAWGYKP
jgi:hypothetical protein